jgi:hypothetical protein
MTRDVHPTSEAPLRLVIASTPRCGNAWLRHLLHSIYDLSSLSVHNPADVNWAELPTRCIIQIHWHPTPPFLEQLDTHRFHVLTLARHPLDVLLSILHFALYDSSTARWLEGENGSERSIFGAMPCSSAFLEYATGQRAGALLSVSREWAARPGVRTIRYEDLVRDPHGRMEQLAQELGMPASHAIDDAISAQSLANRRQTDKAHHYHYWQGKPGQWKHLLPATHARQIEGALREHFQALGYVCDPDPALDVRQADANWIELIWSGLAKDLQNVEAACRERDRLRIELGAAHADLEATRKSLALTQAELARFADLGPLAIAAVRRWHRLALRLPRLSALLRRVARSFLKSSSS